MWRDFLLQFGRCEAEWVDSAEVAYERCREALRTDVARCDVVLDGQIVEMRWLVRRCRAD